MVKPHIISKKVNKDTQEEIIIETQKSEKLVSLKTISKIKDLMESVIKPGAATGSKYYLEGYDIIGKTGTAQIYENGKYLTGENDYIVSVSLMYPKDDPEIIIYAAVKKPKYGKNSVLPKNITELIENISKYKKMFEQQNENTKNNTYIIPTYKNRKIQEVKEELEKNKFQPIIIGNGDRIINQYPIKNTTLISGDKVFLLTNENSYIMPDMSNWSRYDVVKFCEFMKIEYSFEGYGYVASQSIKEGTKIEKNSKLEILLGNIIPN